MACECESCSHIETPLNDQSNEREREREREERERERDRDRLITAALERLR